MQRTPAENRALIDDLKKKREAFIDDAMERRAWTDEKRARNAIGQLRVDGVPIIIDAAKSRQLDEAGNIAPSPAHREELQRILLGFPPHLEIKLMRVGERTRPSISNSRLSTKLSKI